jgi:hypothetical protein
LHLSISAKTSFYRPAFEISRSCRTASGGTETGIIKTISAAMFILGRSLVAQKKFK